MVAAGPAFSGHLKHEKPDPVKVAKGVVLIARPVMVVLVVAIVRPVGWQVRGAVLPVSPYPVSQPFGKVQVLPTSDPCQEQQRVLCRGHSIV